MNDELLSVSHKLSYNLIIHRDVSKMFIAPSLIALAALATSVSAISFTNPAEGENVNLVAGHTVEWFVAAIDPSSAYLVLVNHPSILVVLSYLHRLVLTHISKIQS